MRAESARLIPLPLPPGQSRVERHAVQRITPTFNFAFGREDKRIHLMLTLRGCRGLRATQKGVKTLWKKGGQCNHYQFCLEGGLITVT